ncbi:MAG: hypothetical protein [Arizlama microvirus]|nr:MAG: hypothetical protein [Arizlama microvirus]
MKVELSKTELSLIGLSIEVKIAATQRAINTEKDEEVKAIRQKLQNNLIALNHKILNMELPLNETNDSQQKK